MKRFNVGPCLVCGGRVLRSGKRKHNPDVHAHHNKQRKVCCNVDRQRWPRLLGCGKFLPPARPTTASTEWLCQVLKDGSVRHYNANH